MQRQDDDTAQDGIEPKEGYQAPALRVLGSVAELTQGIGGSNFDPGQGTFTKHGVG